MSLEEYRQAACQGKAVYRSWSEANKVARRVNRRARTEGVVMAYMCRHCRHFHLGQDTSSMMRGHGRRRGDGEDRDWAVTLLDD